MLGHIRPGGDGLICDLTGREVEAAARTLGLELHIANAKHQDEINASFPSLVAQGARAIVIGADA